MIENGGARSKVSITFYMGLIGQRSGDSKATKIAAKLFADIYPSRESTQVFFVADITHAPQRILGLGPRLSDTSVCYGIFNAPVLVLRRALSPTTEPRRQTAESLLRHFSQRDKASQPWRITTLPLPCELASSSATPCLAASSSWCE
jgi:hypothetical protein